MDRVIGYTTSTKVVSKSITINVFSALNFQKLYDNIYNSLPPPDPYCSYDQIKIPFISLDFKAQGIYNFEHDLKEAISNMYHDLMRELLKPIWVIIEKILKILEKFISVVVDLKLPVLDLHVSDIFAPDFRKKITDAIKKLYEKEKDKLIAILKKLGIDYPFQIDIINPEEEIKALIRKVMDGLYSAFWKIVWKIVNIIEDALLLYDYATHGFPTLSVIWKNIKKAIFQKFIEFFTNTPTVEQIKNWIIKFVQAKLHKAEVTFEEIMNEIKNFKIPILGSPFDWHFPISIKVQAPNIDFDKLANDIKAWINAFLAKLLAKFMELIGKILQALGLKFAIPKITIPFIVIENCNTPILA